MAKQPWRGKFTVCIVPGCGITKLNARGLCNRHYLCWQKYGDPTAGKTIGSRKESRRFLEQIPSYEGDDCLIWPFGRLTNGYATFNNQLVSRIVCERVYGPPPAPKLDAAHSCGRGQFGCVNPRHLRWATRKENIHDKKLHGTFYNVGRGERHKSAKLTEEEVRFIRSSKSSCKELSHEFAISQWHIQCIKTRRSWRWLE